MMDIDEILEMLDWNNSQEIQEKSVSLGAEVDDLSVFVQPVTAKHNKNVWDNCALILASKSDEELTPYLPKLLEWLQDLNWPGASTIMERLKKFSGEKLLPYFAQAVHATDSSPDDDNEWLDNLSALYENKELWAKMDGQLYRRIKLRYYGFWNN